jgi:hypothetical protein
VARLARKGFLLNLNLSQAPYARGSIHPRAARPLRRRGLGREVAELRDRPKPSLQKLTNPRSMSRMAKPSEELLLSQQHPHPRDDDRERITRARQEAEALFTPKPQITEQVSSSPLADQSARKPRVLASSPTAPIRHEEVEAMASSRQQRAPEIPRSQFARIRALVKYGMSPAQVAKVYGVAIGAIQSILRKV